jgi:hypothetical protein
MFVSFGLFGCGLSREYRYNELKYSSNDDICMAVADPRASTIGVGWTVRKQAADQIARERGLQCDYEKYSRIHAIQGSTENSLQQMQLGTSLLNQGSVNSPQSAGNSGGGASVGVAFLKSSYISGLNKICIYDRLGSQVVTTIGSTQMCAMTLP